MAERLVIGSRSSKLALTQSNWVADQLRGFHPGLEVSIVEIKTTGDKNLGASLSELGGKGAFTKELEDAMLAGECDIAVHSLKDLPTNLPDGLRVLCTPAREDTADVLVLGQTHAAASNRPLGFLPEGAIVGSSSLRRRAELARLRPDLQVIEFRGNVDTRLRKLKDGAANACILAAAGLKRLGLLKQEAGVVSVDGMAAIMLRAPEWLPAVGQGALGIEGRADDSATAHLLAPLHDAATYAATAAERAFLNRLGAGCQAPVGAAGEAPEGSTLKLIGRVMSIDGRSCIDRQAIGEISDPVKLGREVAEWCLKNGAEGLV